jgi:ABC-type transporter Mla subunit MlaD
MAVNIFEELKGALQKAKDFLDENVKTIQPAIKALAGVLKQINEFIDQLIDLLGKLKTEIQNLKLPDIANDVFEKVTGFTTVIKTLLETTEKLLPDNKGDIDKVIAAADVASSLPSLDKIKGEIVALIDDIINNLKTLKAP